MREFIVDKVEIDRILDDVLCFKAKGVIHQRAKLELSTALIGAVRQAFYLEDVSWPQILVRPGIDEPVELSGVTFDKMNSDISSVVKFTWMMDLNGGNDSPKLVALYGHRPRVKHLMYGLCQRVLADAGFEFESPRSLHLRQTVAGWFKMTDVRDEWDLRALLCLIDYFQENSRTFLYPPLGEYLQRRKQGRKLQTAILSLMRRVDWNEMLRTDCLNELIDGESEDTLDGMMVILSECWDRMAE